MKSFSKLFCMVALVMSYGLGAQDGRGRLEVDATRSVSSVSPTLYGLMTEEINYSYDGGLYAEMIRNRSFLYTRKGFQYWTAVASGNSQIQLKHGTDGPSRALSTSARLEINEANPKEPAGIANEGYWGISVKPSTEYKGSFFAKPSGVGPARVRLISDETGDVLAESVIPLQEDVWRQYSYVMRTDHAVRPSVRNHFEILFSHAGSVELQVVSLFPPTYNDRPNGNRPDLMKMLLAMSPHFLRFPGGNYLEGDAIAERFDWKQTIGPLLDRPTHRSPWGYQSSDGMGLLEFLEWCEDLKIEPVLAVYAGYSLKGEYAAGNDLLPFIQDDLDEIEYVTGGPETKWGAERAKDGHPAPFPLRYVEVGNEDYNPASRYDDRFEQISKAIRAKYPNLKLIATTPVKKGTPDLVDDHYYKSPQEFFDLVHKYDTVDRNGPKIFIGEWATRTGSPTPNFDAALGDAAWMTSMERNSDLIEMASYAPLFTNVNIEGMQWATDLIGYTAEKAYGSPSYWAQVFFAGHIGDHTVATSADITNSRFFWSATISAKQKMLYLKLVNASDKPQSLDIALKGILSGSARRLTLHASTGFATNSIDQPDAIHPISSQIAITPNWQHDISARTIEVIDIPLR